MSGRDINAALARSRERLNVILEKRRPPAVDELAAAEARNRAADEEERKRVAYHQREAAKAERERVVAANRQEREDRIAHWDVNRQIVALLEANDVGELPSLPAIPSMLREDIYAEAQRRNERLRDLASNVVDAKKIFDEEVERGIPETISRASANVAIAERALKKACAGWESFRLRLLAADVETILARAHELEESAGGDLLEKLAPEFLQQAEAFRLIVEAQRAAVVKHQAHSRAHADIAALRRRLDITHHDGVSRGMDFAALQRAFWTRAQNALRELGVTVRDLEEWLPPR